MKSEQRKVSDAILQKDSKIIINGEEYIVPAPTYGTLIRLSSFINEADISFEVDKVQIADLIKLAKDESAAPAVLATLILGAKECDLPYKEKGLFIYKRNKTKLEYLTEYFTNEVPISDIVTAITDIVNNRMDLVFFYQGITFLKGTNLTKATKEIGQTAPIQ